VTTCSAASALMSRDEVAAHVGISPQSVRTVMRRYGITEVRGYPADLVRNLQRKPRGRTPKDNPR
jgi:hypothetical protein